MRTKQIIKKLAEHLEPFDVERLKLNMALPGSVVMCLCVADIVKSYNSTPEKEEEVARLLSALCNKHLKAAIPN